jgi:hypothetical protein
MRKLLALLLLFSSFAYGQQNNTTNTKFINGLAAPNGTTNPTTGRTPGMMFYKTGVGFQYWDGTAWITVGQDGDGVTSFNSRTGAVVPLVGDYSSFYPLQNGTGATGTWNISISGNAGTVTNGVYTSGSYANPSWITSLAWGKITGAPTSFPTPNALSFGYGLTGSSFDGSVARTVVADTTSSTGLVSKSRLNATNFAISRISGLQTALDGKQSTITTGSPSQYFRGDLSLATFPTNVSSFTNDAGYVTATSTNTFTNKSGNISQWNNDSGYLTSSSGVTSITGTSNQVIASASTGAVTLSLPQSIGTSNTPTFAGLTLTGTLSGTRYIASGNIQGSATSTNTNNIGAVSGNPNYVFNDGNGIWGFRTDASSGFNIDVYNGGSQVNALKISQTGTATFGNIVTSVVASNTNAFFASSASGGIRFIPWLTSLNGSYLAATNAAQTVNQDLYIDGTLVKILAPFATSSTATFGGALTGASDITASGNITSISNRSASTNAGLSLTTLGGGYPYLIGTSETTGGGIVYEARRASNISSATGFSSGAHQFNTNFSASTGYLFNILNNSSSVFSVAYNGATGISGALSVTGNTTTTGNFYTNLGRLVIGTDNEFSTAIFVNRTPGSTGSMYFNAILASDQAYNASPKSGIAFRQESGTGSQVFSGITGGKENATSGNAASYLSFFTQTTAAGAAERARFTSDGFFKASNTGTYLSSTGAYHEFVSNTNTTATVISSHAGTDPYGFLVRHNTTKNNGTNYFYYAEENSVQRFAVYTNGGIANYQANNVNLSDSRAKKNITKAGSYWDIIKAIEFDKYQYKDQKDQRNLLGVMAQQVESVYPEWVSNAGNFGKADDGTNLKSVYEQQIQYGVNIVVQEAMKRIEVLEAKIKELQK